jgi:F0F1-type ATP synthase assembly protein I
MGKGQFRPLRAAGLLAGSGLALGVAALLGAGLGYYLDGRLGTRPWLMLAGLLLGLAAGFLEMLEILKKLGEW